MTTKNPNPQGKGLTPVLSDWQRYRPLQVTRKDNERLFADYFTSMLVLSAEFNFKPVVGQRYYLYCKTARWQLSLIEPERWDTQASGDCIGECRLHSDMTWSIIPRNEGLTSDPIKAALETFAVKMDEHIQQHLDSNDLLPFYASQLPYYRRLAASGLANSIQSSIKLSADASQTFSDVLRLTLMQPSLSPAALLARL